MEMQIHLSNQILANELRKYFIKTEQNLVQESERLAQEFVKARQSPFA